MCLLSRVAFVALEVLQRCLHHLRAPELSFMRHTEDPVRHMPLVPETVRKYLNGRLRDHVISNHVILYARTDTLQPVRGYVWQVHDLEQVSST